MIKLCRWLSDIQNKCSKGINCILVGNKCENNKLRQVSFQEAKKLASNLGMELFEASAKENINVREIFEAIATLALKSKEDKKRQDDKPSISIDLNSVNLTTNVSQEDCKC